MSRNTKVGLALIGVCAAVVGLIGAYVSHIRAGQTTAATATVISTKLEKKTGKRGKNRLVSTVSYMAATTPAQAKAEVTGTDPAVYPAGRTLRICYNPDDTGSIREDDGPCG
ncbi:MAG TPA: DUF3592 domain-containing protein [Sphingomonas sp.]|nr:DUF3592 domain-containing protein [Sphingomonas sp.]